MTSRALDLRTLSVGAAEAFGKDASERASIGQGLLASLLAIPALDIGVSGEGRPLRAAHRGPQQGRPLILTFAIHGDELATVELAIQTLSRLDPARSVWILPCLNPDGVARATKNAASGVDLNRNFPASNFSTVHERGYDPGPGPLSQPETAAFSAFLRDQDPAGVVMVHAPFGCVNFDGPAQEWARSIAAASGWPVQSDIGYGTPGSFGSYWGRDWAKPVITLELPPGRLLTFAAAADAALAAAVGGNCVPLRTSPQALRAISLGILKLLCIMRRHGHGVGRVVFHPLFLLSPTAMDKEFERRFLAVYARGLVSLPFDVKILLEAVTDADLELPVRQLAAATVVHIINPKDGNVEPVLRHAEDVIFLRLALRKILKDGGEGAEAFRERFSDLYDRLDDELVVLEQGFSADVVSWLDSRWPALLKVVYARKKISQFVEDEELGTLLYDDGMRFGTDFRVTEKSVEGRLKQAQPIVDHLTRKRESDRKKISS